MIKAQQQKNNMDKFFQKYAKGTLHSHSAIAPFGSPNTVYTVHSLHFALPYFAPLRSAKHRIYLTLDDIFNEIKEYMKKIKENELKKLGEKRQKYKMEGYNNLSFYHNGVYDCKFVSPYTKYAGNVDSEILFFLQDWSSDNSLSGKIDQDSITYGHSRHVRTNINLKELVLKHLNKSLNDFYVSNVFPFIKKGKMNSQIPIKDIKHTCNEFALPQIYIIKPLLVICLGLQTFNAFTRTINNKKYENLETAISSPFIHDNIIYYCQAHPAQLGLNTRNRGGINRVETDWSNMIKFLENTTKHRLTASIFNC